eukprot:Hpha_TRINITY_DN24317_c0_g1::TRINITY_DN24317_c0_g1_i1::g.148032::m.148032/K01062/PLA2G7, PAFAH; platelet-activating factor acetylhydrolase
MALPGAIGGTAGLVTAAAAYVRWRSTPSLSFPEPQGPYRQLTATHIQLPQPAGVSAQVVRPARTQKGAGRCRYYRTEALYALTEALTGSAWQRWLMTPLLLLTLGGRNHPDPLPPEGVGEEEMPVVIFCHGLFGSADMYTQLCREIASYGCIVIALEHQDGSATGSRSIPYRKPPAGLQYSDRSQVQAFRKSFLAHRKEELLAVVDLLRTPPPELRGADLSRLVLAGHSFGCAGIMSTLSDLNASSTPPRAVLLYDPWSYPLPDDVVMPPSTPAVCILSQTFYKGIEFPAVRNMVRDACGADWLPNIGHQFWADFTWIRRSVRVTKGDDDADMEAHKSWVRASFELMDSVLGRQTHMRSNGGRGLQRAAL